MAAHIHHLAQENVAGVHGMERIDLSVLGAIEIINVVALYGLIEERESEGQDEQHDDEEFPAQEIKIAGPMHRGVPAGGSQLARLEVGPISDLRG